MRNSLEAGHWGVAVTWRYPLDVNESFVQWRKVDPIPVEANTLFEKRILRAERILSPIKEIPQCFRVSVR